MTDSDYGPGGRAWEDVTTSLPDDVEHDLRDMARGDDEGLAKMATAMLAWVHSNDRDRQQRNRLIGVLIVIGLLVFGQNVQAQFQRDDFAEVQRSSASSAADAKALAAKINECIGEDPNTPCRQTQARNTTPVVGLLQKSIDCQALRREGSRPAPCASVNERTDLLEAGIDPFPAPAGTTTTTRGNS